MATRKENLEALAKLMKKIDIGMLTTVGPNGYLVSRPLSTQEAEFDGERVWFFTDASSPKAGEIARNPKVNIAYASKDKNTYISAAGDARINRDRSRIDQFWNDALKAFFPKGKNDPNLALIEVELRTIEYWDGPGTWIGKAITFVAARVTGNDDLMGENRIVDVTTGRSRKAPGSDTGGASTRSAARGLSKRPAKKSAAKASGKTATRRTPPKKTARKAPAKTAGRKAAARKPAAKKKAAPKVGRVR